MVRLSEVSHSWLEEGSPIVAVSGTWLKDFGFEEGKKVFIDICQGQIVIKLIDCED